MIKEAWAQNAVITRDDGRNIRYKPRCPKCGYVPPNRDCGGTASAGIRSSYFGSCDKCGETFTIVTGRG